MSPEADPSRSSEEPPRWGEVHVDLEPMYELTEAEHIRIINQLSDLLLTTVRLLKILDVSSLAGEGAGSASAILTGYDPDVADVIGRAASSLGREKTQRQTRAEVMPGNGLQHRQTPPDRFR